MPNIPPSTNPVKRRQDYESSHPIYRAVCTVTECGWVYEPEEGTHVDLVKARAAAHAYHETHVVDVRFDILNQLVEHVYPRMGWR